MSQGLGMLVLLGCGRVGFDEAGAGDASDAAAGLGWEGATNGTAEAVSLASISTAELVPADPGAMYLAIVSVKPSRAVSGVSGLGLSWQLVREQCGGRDTARLAMYWASAPAPVATVVTADLNNGTAFLGSAVITVHRFSPAGAVSIGTASWANINGHDGDPPCTGGIDASTYTWATLDVAAASSTIIAAVHTARYTHEPGYGFVELFDQHSADSGGAAGIAVEAKPADQPVDNVIEGTFSSSPDWAAIAVELRR